MEQVQMLEEHIKEIELGGGQTMDKVLSHRASVVIEDVGDQQTMEENMKKSNVTEL
jgi:hypothetical protein